MLHGGLVFFNAANVGEARAGPQPAGEIRQLLGSSDGVYLDPAVVQIACETAYAELRRRALGEVTEPNSLNAPAYEVALGRELCGRHVKL